MSKLETVRTRLRGELEAPPALRKFGSGWISGVLGLVLGIASFSLVLALRLPGVFQTPEAQGLYLNPWFRFGLQGVLLVAFVLSALSLVLRKGKTLGTCGIALTLLATLLGGSTATPAAPDATALYIGLDFFVLRILFTGLLFIPLERLFAHRAEQHIFQQFSLQVFNDASVGMRAGRCSGVVRVPVGGGGRGCRERYKRGPHAGRAWLLPRRPDQLF